MIKNLLYSLFLHTVLLAAIYANFNLQYKEEEKLSEIVVSINIPTPQSSEPQEEKAKEENPKEETKPIKKEEEKKEEKKKQKQIKTEKKPKAQKKEIKKEVNESPNKEFKKPEEEDKKEVVTKKLEEKPEELTKTTEDKKEETVAEDKKNEKITQNKEENQNLETFSNTIENLNLSAREKFNIQTQLRRCYRKAIEESKKSSKIKLTVKANIDENGYINLILSEENEEETKATEEYKIAINNAKRAAQICSPLRNLPLDKYYIWKEVTLQFDEDN